MCISFTKGELQRTEAELRSKIADFFRKPVKSDVLLGDHWVVKFASRIHSIAIWHGTRIESHLAEWIERIPDWEAATRETVQLSSGTREIDNIAWNRALNLVLCVECKREWANQDAGSKRDVRNCHALYTAESAAIANRAGIKGGEFRFFVFDVFGNTRKGSKGLPVICGDKIASVFGLCLWNYINWEREVIRSAIFQSADLPDEATQGVSKLLEQIFDAQDQLCPHNRSAIVAFIDSNAN